MLKLAIFASLAVALATPVSAATSDSAAPIPVKVTVPLQLTNIDPKFKLAVVDCRLSPLVPSDANSLSSTMSANAVDLGQQPVAIPANSTPAMVTMQGSVVHGSLPVMKSAICQLLGFKATSTSQLVTPADAGVTGSSFGYNLLPAY